jgi:hypothetical protein
VSRALREKQGSFARRLVTFFKGGAELEVNAYRKGASRVALISFRRERKR